MKVNTDGLTGSIEIGPRDAEAWRQSDIAVRVYGFSAECVCSVGDEEPRQFLSELETALSRLGQECDLDLQTMERGITLRIHLNPRGHVEGSYEYGPDWRGPLLSGSFSADQTHLRAWAKELRDALRI